MDTDTTYIPRSVAGFIALTIPIESNFKISTIALWTSCILAVIIILLLFIHIRMNNSVRKSLSLLHQKRIEIELASELTHLGVWTLHLDTMTFTLSEEAATLLGNPDWTNSHPSVEYMLNFIHHQDHQDIRNSIQEILDGKTDTSTFAYRFRTDNVHYRTFSLNSRVFVDSNKKRHLVGTLIDVTQQVHLHRERDALLQSLTARNQELEQYAYSISHDLKTPLVTVEGFVHLLKSALEEKDQEGIDNAIQRISNSTTKLKDLIESLLSLSRLGQITDKKQPVNLNQIVQEVVELNQATIQQSGAEIKIGELPTVSGDTSRLLQVFHNLINNALKFTYNQDQPKITIDHKMIDGIDTITVEDNGVGIEASACQEVFGLFHRMDRNTSGSGFGLALVKRIIDAHGGKIWIESAGINEGTTVFIQL